MSYYFGVTLPAASIICSDRKRSRYSGSEFVDSQLESKIYEIRDNLYLAGAGLLHFVDDMGVRAFPQVFQKAAALKLNDVEESLDEISGWLDQNYRQLVSTMAQQAQNDGIDSRPLFEQDTALLLAGVDATSTPFLVAFHAAEKFKPHLLRKAFESWLICLYPDEREMDYVVQLHEKMREAVTHGLKQLAAIKNHTQQLTMATEILPKVIAMAAREDSSVSREYDLVVVTANGATTSTGVAKD
jgi:hypothetical protein